MDMTEEQLVAELTRIYRERKAANAPITVKSLRGFEAQPPPPRIPSPPQPDTKELQMQKQYEAFLRKLGIPPQGIGLDLQNYPLPKKTQRADPSRKVKVALLAAEPYCAYRHCNNRATTIDHVVPKARGGSNDPRNLVTCCLDCNASKGPFLPKELGWKIRVPRRAFDNDETWRID